MYSRVIHTVGLYSDNFKMFFSYNLLKCILNRFHLVDNVPRVREFGRVNDIHLRYVPPYSPWYNPIEGVFSLVKRHFARNKDVGCAFGRVQSDHVRSFFRFALRLRETST